MKNSDVPARPVNTEEYSHEGGHSCDSFGLTKREQFAAMAMQGLTANSGVYIDMIPSKTIAKAAISAADALLKELENDK